MSTNETLRKLAERNLTIAELRIWLWIYTAQSGRKRLFLSDIARPLGLQVSSVQGALTRLREAGLVENESNHAEFGKVLRVVSDPRQWKPDERPQRRPRVAKVEASSGSTDVIPAEEIPA